ncbi:LamG-like jellyroll fold domain-containing protein [Soonwooa sp.]|uniref:LamG-like jellyroll fold domain-containing protein n=1 Tax=Soonwooa sp. TaxID=1938592 RepID=UPI0028A89FCF|nr:LamG-like jellyroll fold domain-containing protein [Soonwooa sp.]
MKKYFYILLIMIGFLTKAQNPIYHFKFDNSLAETNNPAHTFTMYSNGVTASPYYSPDRFGAASGSLIRIPNTTNFFVSSVLPNLPVGNAARTISFWVRITDITQYDIQHFVGYGANSNGESFGFSHGPNNTIRNYYWGNETNKVQYFKFGTWYHIAATYNPSSSLSKGNLFINGQLVGTSNITINTNSSEKKLYIGTTGASGLSSDKGFQIDDLKIYDTTLTEQQIFNEYQGEVTNSYPTTNLLAYFNFENNLTSHNGNYKFQETNNNNIPFVNTINGKGISFQQSYSLMNKNGIPGSGNISNDLGNEEFTIAFWYYTDGITATIPYPTVFEMNETLYFRHQVNPTAIYDAWGWLGVNNIWSEKNIGFGTGGWHHIAIVHKTSANIGMRMYFDGIDYGMNTSGYNAVGLLNNLKSVYLGGGTSGGTLSPVKRFNGKIDVLFFYNRALSSQEISQLKNYRTSNSLSVKDIEKGNNKFTIFPNPTSDYIQIKGEISNNTWIKIYDNTGKIALYKTTLSEEKKVAVNHLPKGVYTIVIATKEGNTESHKFIKK